jgi:hypothetical protein
MGGMEKLTDVKKNFENQDQIPIYIEKPSIRVDVDIYLETLHQMMDGDQHAPWGSTSDEFLKVGDISPDLAFEYVPDSKVSIIYNVKEDLNVNQINNLVSAILEKIRELLDMNKEYEYDMSVIKRVVVHGNGELGKQRVLEVLKELVWYLTDQYRFGLFMDGQPASLYDHLIAMTDRKYSLWNENFELAMEIGDILDKLLQYFLTLLNEEKIT